MMQNNVMSLIWLLTAIGMSLVGADAIWVTSAVICATLWQTRG